MVDDRRRELLSKLSKHREEDGQDQIFQPIGNHPRGNPQLATFNNSFASPIFSRIRALSGLQNELSILEKSLIEADDRDNKSQLASRERGEGVDGLAGNVLIEKIENGLKELQDRLAVLQNEIYLSRSPTSQNAGKLLSFVRSHNSLSPEESTNFRCKDGSMAPSKGQETSWPNGIVNGVAKTRSDGSTIAEPQSATELLLSSRDTYNNDSIDAAPPVSVGVVVNEPTQTALSAATNARPSSTSSVQPFSGTIPETASCIKSLLSCSKSLCSNRLGSLLAIPCILPCASAAEDLASLTPKPGPPWPLSEGPPGLWDSIIAIIIAINITVLSYSVRKWQKLQDPFLWALLLGFCSLVGLSMMNDPGLSNTNLLSLGLLQVYLCQHFARMSHRINSHVYKMSIHFWFPIFVLTGLFAYLCMKASPVMYSRDSQLPGFPFIIPCFGVSVPICVYLGYLWKLWQLRAGPLLPRFVWP